MSASVHSEGMLAAGTEPWGYWAVHAERKKSITDSRKKKSDREKHTRRSYIGEGVSAIVLSLVEAVPPFEEGVRGVVALVEPL